MRHPFYALGALLAIVALLLAGAASPVAPTYAAADGGPQYCSAANAAPAKVKVGDVRAYELASPRPLPASWSTVVTSPNAKFLRLHFVDFQLGAGDTLTVSSLDGAQAWTYTDRGLNGDGDFWAFAIDADAVKIEVNAPSGTASFRIAGLGHGSVSLNKKPDPTPEVVCGTDGRENIACRTGDPVINAAQRPVARLLFTSGGSQYVCTGELVRGSNASTLITNNHCLATQQEVNTLQAKFNYQSTSCTSPNAAPTTDYAGGTFLKTSAEAYRKRTAGSGLDYTLLTLQGNPEATWGELIPTAASYSTNTQINFIQHPGGNPKKIGYWEDAAQTSRCKINSVGQTYGSAAPKSQAGYGCDSEGGSSGSAITRASDGKIIALHHYGGVSTNPCLNSGTMMSLICQNAGSLLQCDSN